MSSTILVPLDGSEVAELALPVATNLARAGGARLVLVRVVWTPGVPGIGPGEAIFNAWSEADAYLIGVAKQLAASGVSVERRVRYEHPVEGILAETAAEHADLLVMCTHGRTGLARLLYGSVAAGVVHSSSVPVLLVRAGAAEPVRNPQLEDARILVPLERI